MPGQKHRKRKVEFPRQDQASLSGKALVFLEWMAVKNYSKQSIRNRKLYLCYFVRWCEERGLVYPNEITKPIVERY